MKFFNYLSNTLRRSVLRVGKRSPSLGIEPSGDGGANLVPVHQAIMQLWEMAASHGARLLELDPRGEKPRYTFATSEGKNGVGSLSSALVKSLPAWVQEVRVDADGVYSRFSVETAFDGRIFFGLKTEKVADCLFLDDQPVYAALLQKRCASEGISVEVTQDAFHARSRLGESPEVYRMFLCDVHLGEKSGIDIVRELRGAGHKGAIAMVSSDADVEAQRSALDAGADAYFVKSEDPAVIVAFMKRVIEERRA